MTEKERITEQLITKLNETLLLEMAYPLKDIYRKIDDNIDIVIKHLILCLVFSETSPDTLKHWQSEVYNYIHRMWKIEGINKLPTYKQLTTNCLNTWSDSLRNSLPNEINSLADIEDLPIPRYNVDKLYCNIINYFEWLFKKLSQSESVSFSEVKTEIDKLIEDYNK